MKEHESYVDTERERIYFKSTVIGTEKLMAFETLARAGKRNTSWPYERTTQTRWMYIQRGGYM